MRATICNIGPSEFYLSRSYGQFHILPAERTGKPGLTILEDRNDRIDLGECNYLPFPLAARTIAEDLVNEGLRPHGCFVCAGERPTASEIAAATKIRDDYYRAMVQQGDELWAKYHRHEMIDDNSRRAVAHFGLDREWVVKTSAKVECACGETVPATVGKHTCGAIVNIDRALAYGQINAQEADRLRKLRKKLDVTGSTPEPVAPPADDYVDPAEQVLDQSQS